MCGFGPSTPGVRAPAREPGREGVVGVRGDMPSRKLDGGRVCMMGFGVFLAS